MPSGQSVADFLGQGDDPALVAMATDIVPIITAMVRSYTRGRGFDAGEPNDELAAVITCAAARMIGNPEQIQYKVGTVEMRGGFQGWTLPETFVLNRYRVTAL